MAEIGAGALLLIAGIIFYFVPSITASRRGHPQVTPITLLNLFLGWTIIGWIAAMIWATTNWVAGQTWAEGTSPAPPAARVCAQCGLPVGGARFCGNCGTATS